MKWDVRKLFRDTPKALLFGKSNEDDDKQLYFDKFSSRYYRASIEVVLRAEYQINRALVMRDHVCLNEYYGYLGIKPITIGFEYGWSQVANAKRYSNPWIDFAHEKVLMDDGLECTIIVIQSAPMPDFRDYA